MDDHVHRWYDSRQFFVGQLYPSIYPYACKCGAFRKADGEIVAPREPSSSAPNPPSPTSPSVVEEPSGRASMAERVEFLKRPKYPADGEDGG